MTGGSSLTIKPYKGKTPNIHKNALVSPLATIIGDVKISKDTSVFPEAVIRGDVAKITIGKCTNIQDNVVIHGGDIYTGDKLKGHIPVKIGDYVTVGHSAVIHGCEIGNIVLIGARAVVFNESVIGRGSIIGMGAVVLENTRIPKKSIAVGMPAKVIKPVDNTTYSKLKKHAVRYHKLASLIKALSFNWVYPCGPFQFARRFFYFLKRFMLVSLIFSDY